MEDKKKIMDMVKEGKISIDQALELLEALEPSGEHRGFSLAPTSSAPQGTARLLRIQVDAQEAKVRVNVPVALAKFALSFVPEEARENLSDRGIDLSNLLDSLGSNLPEGRLVEIEGSDDGEPFKVIVEVV
ncbi:MULTISPECIES: hypothetical protein [unclassified Meiothermus]|uniref:SHOCT-like domain-containing protein n=1 Tax=unclassified Meiothermus TaxID=370471 RepID=UPI000D7C46F1|nr:MULTISPECIES: hypothetical protein [unclassified Meiothermus]PZA06707.1 hypothetical protein DNA98_11990 [Meiothermus sp. Pnk-1]RYM36633.1 hypothetical protein EWH23_09000 [Meiothermus sp. PNK-Is4]